MVRSPTCSCPHTTHLFNLLGKKWVIFIMQAVDQGSSTFTEIRKNIGDANTKILTDRLADLIELKIIKKSETGEYILSHLGKELSQKLIELGYWWGHQEK